jgi:hypothetical protein
MNKYLNWWNKFSPITKEILQRRYYPATNWKYLRNDQIEDIYNKEKLN